MKLKRGIPLIDQHDQHGFWGGKFGGSFIPETLKKPIEDLEILFNKLKNRVLCMHLHIFVCLLIHSS